MKFEYTYSQQEKFVIVSLSGNLIEKIEAMDLLYDFDKWLSEGQRIFALNLEQLHYMNSSGLGILINLLTKSRNKDGEIVIYNVSEKVKDLLVITKLHQVFNVADSYEDAVKVIEKF